MGNDVGLWSNRVWKIVPGIWDVKWAGMCVMGLGNGCKKWVGSLG